MVQLFVTELVQIARYKTGSLYAAGSAFAIIGILLKSKVQILTEHLAFHFLIKGKVK